MSDADDAIAALKDKTENELNVLSRSPDPTVRAAARTLLLQRPMADLARVAGDFAATTARFIALKDQLAAVAGTVAAAGGPAGDLARVNALLSEVAGAVAILKDEEGLPPAVAAAAEAEEPVADEAVEPPPPPGAPAPPAPPPPPAQPSRSTSYGAIAEEYRAYFAAMALRPERRPIIERLAASARTGKARYRAVGDPLGIPWHFIAIIHGLESGFDFETHLHNGDPLSARTVRVPAGRPADGAPPFAWEASARDALTLKGYGGLRDWSLPRLLYRWEAFNGFGYRKFRSIATPYLWSFSTVYEKGKYVADGRYDENAVSRQPGAAVVLRQLVDEGEVTV